MLLRIGAMGSGKTSAANKIIEQHLGWCSELFYLIDLDKMVTTHESYVDGYDPAMTPAQLDKLWSDSQKAVNGYNLMESLISKQFQLGRHISVESTGNYFCPNRKKILESYKQGYTVVIIFCYVPFFELVKRVNARALAEGRGTNIESLKKNVINSINKLWEYIYITDRFFIIDNFVERGKLPNIILETKLDFKRRDSSSCTDVPAIDKDRLRNLAEVLHTNRDVYSDNDWLDVWDEERLFIAKLLSMKFDEVHQRQPGVMTQQDADLIARILHDDDMQPAQIGPSRPSIGPAPAPFPGDRDDMDAMDSGRYKIGKGSKKSRRRGKKDRYVKHNSSGSKANIEEPKKFPMSYRDVAAPPSLTQPIPTAPTPGDGEDDVDIMDHEMMTYGGESIED